MPAVGVDARVDVPLMMEAHCFKLKMYRVMYDKYKITKFETKINGDITTDSIQEKSLWIDPSSPRPAPNSLDLHFATSYLG